MDSAANSDEQASERINSEVKEDEKKQDLKAVDKSVAATDKAGVAKAAGAASKQQQRREGQIRRKDDKNVEHVLRALNSLNTPEEKLAAMCKKYADLVNDQRAMQNAARVAEKRISVLQREKEQLQVEQSKAVLVRSRLENLCRELQRHNKAIKDECAMRIREEEERRKEVSAKFQATLNEITAMMKQNSDKNSKLRDDNIDMTAKLKSVCQEFEKRELHVEQLVKQFQLEVQLADAKLAKAKMEMSTERDTLLREKQQLLLEVVEYKKRLELMQDSELQLKTQMSVYNDKYEEFHKALIQSNHVISGFKTEIDNMSKQIRKLEKETCAWKTKYDETQNALLRMTDERVRGDEALERANRRVATLHNLCRTLQGQIVEMRNASKSSPGPEKADSTSDLTNSVENSYSDGLSEETFQSNGPATTAVTSANAAAPKQKSKSNAPSTGKSVRAKRSSSPVNSASAISPSDNLPNSTIDSAPVTPQENQDLPTLSANNDSSISIPENSSGDNEIQRLPEAVNCVSTVSPTSNDSGGNHENVEPEEANSNHEITGCNDLQNTLTNMSINKTETDLSLGEGGPPSQGKHAVGSPQEKAKSLTPSGKGLKATTTPGKGKSKSKSGNSTNVCNSAQADIKTLSQKMSQASLT